MFDNKDIHRYSRVDLDDDTTLVLSERLLNSLFEHMKDGLNRTEKLVQEMSKVVIMTSEKQDNLEHVLNKFHQNIVSNNQTVIQTLENNIELLKSKGDENIRNHQHTKSSLDNLGKDVNNIKNNIYKYFVSISVVNTVIGLITIILSWFVFFKN